MAKRPGLVAECPGGELSEWRNVRRFIFICVKLCEHDFSVVNILRMSERERERLKWAKWHGVTARAGDGRKEIMKR